MERSEAAERLLAARLGSPRVPLTGQPEGTPWNVRSDPEVGRGRDDARRRWIEVGPRRPSDGEDPDPRGQGECGTREAGYHQPARALPNCQECAAWLPPPTVFSERDAIALEELAADLESAGELAGMLCPRVARRAHATLSALASQAGWTRRRFRAALAGTAEDPADEAALLDFDRGALRSRWTLGWGAGGEFGPLALAQGEASAAILRAALSDVAHRAWSGEGVLAARGEDATLPQSAFLRLERDADLPRVLAAANHALLAHEEAYPVAVWDAHGDSADVSAQRLYRLRVQYPGRGRGPVPAPADRQLWVLAMPRRPRDLEAEAALQRYIAGWRRRAAVRSERWWIGLRTLADQLQTVP